MADTGIFISSCSRREWARRRPGRTISVLPVLVVVAVVLAMILAALVLSRGGI